MGGYSRRTGKFSFHYWAFGETSLLQCSTDDFHSLWTFFYYWSIPFALPSVITPVSANSYGLVHQSLYISEDITANFQICSLGAYATLCSTNLALDIVS